jgi:hypothetical protein
MGAVVYFSGSISGGREDVETYRRIVRALEADGHRVFAGSVTSPDVGPDGEPMTPAAIFDRDTDWMREVASSGGVLVAEVSRPSHGVGYEIAMARYHYGMRVICLWRPAFTKRCSGMIAGDRGIRLIEYAEGEIGRALEELRRLLRS